MSQKLDKKTGKWYYYGTYYLNGKKKQYKKRGFPSKKVAKEQEELFKAKNGLIGNNQIIVDDNPITFEELSEMFLEDHTKDVKKSTIRNQSYQLKVMCMYIGSMRVVDLTENILQGILNTFDSKYAKSTCGNLYSTMNACLDFAVIKHIIKHNPMAYCRISKRKGEKKKDIDFWEDDEFKKFISCVDSPRYHLLYSVLYYMGLRNGECCVLQWKHIDFERRTMKIEQTVSYDYSITDPKSRNSTRTIGIPSALLEELKMAYRKAKKYVEFDDDIYVFGNDKPITETQVRYNFYKYIDKAGVKKIRVHDLRHSHASFLINNMDKGFSDYDIAKRLGDTVQTLHSTYAHWFKQRDEKIINFMNRTFGQNMVESIY